MDPVWRVFPPCIVFYTLIEGTPPRSPLHLHGHFLWLFIGNLVGLPSVFLCKCGRLSHCVCFIPAVGKESHPEFLVLVSEAVPVKDIILSERDCFFKKRTF